MKVESMPSASGDLEMRPTRPTAQAVKLLSRRGAPRYPEPPKAKDLRISAKAWGRTSCHQTAGAQGAGKGA